MTMEDDQFDVAKMWIETLMTSPDALTAEAILHGLAEVLSTRTNDHNMGVTEVNAHQRVIRAVCDAKRVAEANKL